MLGPACGSDVASLFYRKHSVQEIKVAKGGLGRLKSKLVEVRGRWRTIDCRNIRITSRQVLDFVLKKI